MIPSPTPGPTFAPPAPTPRPRLTQCSLPRLARCGVGLACALAALLPGAANAAGFFIQEQSARDMGAAFAGSAAVAEDAATIFYNPAGLTRLEGPTFQSGLFLIVGRAKLDNDGTTATTPATQLGGIAPVPIPGEDGGDGEPFDPTPTAALYLGFPVLGDALDDRFWAGFGISAPFGLAANYAEDWFGRYDSTESSLVTYDLSPTLAFAVTEWLSLGGSVNLQYADAHLENRLPNPLDPIGPTAATDGRLEVNGDDWSVGFTAGALLEPIEGTRVGASFRYGISHELDGSAEFSGLSGPLAAQNGNFGGSADLDLPHVVMIGLAHDLTDRLTLLGQLNWFDWSSFDEIRVELETGTDLVSEQDYDDSVAAMVGLQYRVTDGLTLRTGFQYDETPTTDELRSTRTPDADRYWLAVGASYDFGDRISLLGTRLSLDASYVHIFVKDTEVDRTDTFYAEVPAIASTVTTRADVEASVDLFALQLRVRF